MEFEKNLNITKKLGISLECSSKLKKYVYGDTIDELVDGLAVLRDGEFINHFAFGFENLTEEQLLRLDDIMLTTDDAEQIVKYAKRRKEKINTQKYQDKLIELRNIHQLVHFSIFAMNLDVEKTENAVIAYGDACNANRLIEEVNGVNEEKMRKFIFEKGNEYEVYRYIRSYKKRAIAINMNVMFEAKKIVIASQDMQTIMFWADEIGDTSEMQDITIQYGKAWPMYNFAKEVEKADIEKIRVAIKKTGEKNIIKRFNDEFPIVVIKKSFFASRFRK